MDHNLECSTCKTIYGPGGYPKGCPKCNESNKKGVLKVIFDQDSLNHDLLPFGDGKNISDMWRYKELLPLIPEEPITLGEGGTPLIKSSNAFLDLPLDVFYKNETVNPTWSFKDRLYSLMISNITELGYDKLVNSSTGNAGASAAAYAAKAGIQKTIIIAPDECEIPIRNQIISHGAELVIVDFNRRSDLLNLLVDRGWYPVINGLHYSSEGYKTISFELVEQMNGPPDVIVFPTGIGDGLSGIWNGFKVLHQLDIISTLPRIIGVQSQERQPLVRALATNSKHSIPDNGPMPLTISTSGTMTGTYAIDAVRESRGCAYAISRNNVEHSIKETAKDGLFVEPATALTTACLRSAYEDGNIDKGESIVCISTGTGVKWPIGIGSIFPPVSTIEPTIDSLKKVVPFEL